jgi:ABC-type polysaccharide/polyol phosphate transport system ATPase subunit
MAVPRVQITGVTKRYTVGGVAYGTLRDRLARLLRAPSSHAYSLTAVDDLTLAVAAGETLGVVGPNGAGKSTLLKLVARITHPDQGRIEVRGRLSALIEVGAGFHPELTAEENVVLHGSILGLPRRTLRRQMAEILAFAGVQDRARTPVKHFSTGMYARLGFAVAVHADPGVLLVDEVLSVGDAVFRARCYERIDELRAQGTAILFVSHDLDAVRQVADRAIWLAAGVVARAGTPGDVVGAYLSTTQSEAPPERPTGAARSGDSD